MTFRSSLASPQLRWMVRLEHAKPTRFGEPPRAGLLWTVTPYMARAKDGRLLGAHIPIQLPTRSAALRVARDRMRAVYGTAAVPVQEACS